MRPKRFVLPLVCIALLPSCASQPNCNSVPIGQQGKITISTGVWGVAKAYVGDFMPGVDSSWTLFPKVENCRGTISPIQGDLGVFSPVTFDEATQSLKVPSQYSLPRPPIATVSTDQGGFFEVSLAPGTYSIFLRKDAGWYVNVFSGDNPSIFGKVLVSPGHMTEFDIEDKRRATF